MNFVLLLFCVLLSAAGWWFGMVIGVLWSLFVAGGLAAARGLARRRDSTGSLAAMPTWQIALVPPLALALGFALGVLGFLFGPGF